jgi:uncharacterized Ntn-hydrolase superfamily protein
MDTDCSGPIDHRQANCRETRTMRKTSLILLGVAALAAALWGRTESDRAGSRDSDAGSAAGLRDEPNELANDFGKSGTFSIVAIDPKTGVCGAAVASRYPAVGSVVPYARGGAGAFCTQHYHHPAWGARALDLLEEGKSASDVLAELLRDDPRPLTRQLAIVDRLGSTAQHNPSQAPAESNWWGSAAGAFYACQGNTLAGRKVVVAMAAAYETTEGSLADRLMAALVEGDCAGGDHRGRLAAGVVVAKPGIDGDWLRLRVDKSDDAVLELARKYVELEHEAKGAWSSGKSPWQHPCPDRPQTKTQQPEAPESKPEGT